MPASIAKLAAIITANAEPLIKEVNRANAVLQNTTKNVSAVVPVQAKIEGIDKIKSRLDGALKKANTKAPLKPKIDTPFFDVAQLTQGTSGIVNVLSGLAGPAGVAVTAIAAVVTAVVTMTTATANSEVQLQSFARRLGTTANEIRTLQNVGNLAGVQTSAVNEAANSLSQLLFSARQGNLQSIATLRSFNITAEEAANIQLPEAFNRVLSTLNQIDGPMERERIGLLAFGNAATQMSLLFDQGTEALERVREEVNALGSAQANLDDSRMRSMVASSNRLWATFDQVRRSAASAFSPVIIAFFNNLNAQIQFLLPLLQMVFAAFSITTTPIRTLWNLGTAVFRGLRPLLQALYDGAVRIGEAFQRAFQMPSMDSFVDLIARSIELLVRHLVPAIERVAELLANWVTVMGQFAITIRNSVLQAFLNMVNVMRGMFVFSRFLPGLQGLSDNALNVADMLERTIQGAINNVQPAQNANQAQALGQNNGPLSLLKAQLQQAIGRMEEQLRDVGLSQFERDLAVFRRQLVLVTESVSRLNGVNRELAELQIQQIQVLINRLRALEFETRSRQRIIEIRQQVRTPLENFRSNTVELEDISRLNQSLTPDQQALAFQNSFAELERRLVSISAPAPLTQFSSGAGQAIIRDQLERERANLNPQERIRQTLETMRDLEQSQLDYARLLYQEFRNFNLPQSPRRNTPIR